ncbi:exodeoxyribonuclease III [Rahnella aquatilis CIP 78.65 = ATCC 33071]|nr:exodeoxyribonuclease III [Rahnella aquatilis CIP 78.65 = ATCC 33071]
MLAPCFLLAEPGICRFRPAAFFCYYRPSDFIAKWFPTMKFVSFNINGLRARPHQLAAIIEQHQPDVIGLQETKVHDDMFPLEEVSQHGYHVFYHGQKGHYGVAMLTRQEPVAVRRGFPGDGEESQRRIIMTDIETPQGILTVINGYFPQGESRDHPTKFPAKEKFYRDLQDYLSTSLSVNNPVVVMGDVNISPTDLDIGIGEDSRKRWLRTGKCSFLPEEREWMDRLKGWGLVDTFRAANPDTADKFSWFDYRSRGFDENRGLRIDLIMASTPLAARCTATGIDYDIRGMEKPSDHAPIWATFDLK